MNGVFWRVSFKIHLFSLRIKHMGPGGAVPRWQRNRTGRPLSPHIFIKSSFECWATSTKQLLYTGGGHQAPRKAAHSLWKDVGQNIKDKKRDQTVRDEDLSWGESCKRRSFQTVGNPLTDRSVGSFGISEGNITGREKKKTKNHHHHNTEYAPNCQWRSSPEARVSHQRARAGQEGVACTVSA